MCDGISFKVIIFAPSDPCQMQDNWKVSEGFVAEEAKALLPHRATGRYIIYFRVLLYVICKSLVESKDNQWENLHLPSGLLIFRAVAEPRISSKSAKSREIHKNTRNPAKFARNLPKYMSAQHI